MVLRVRVFQTAALTEYCESAYGAANRFQAAERVIQFLRYAWDRTEYVDVEVEITVGERPVEAPTESVSGEITVEPGEPTYPCEGDEPDTFDGLLEWWRAYHTCADDVETAPDSNLLLTDEEAEMEGHAMLGRDPYTVANNGRGCADAPDPRPYRRSPIRYGERETYEPLTLAVHEIGHNLMASDDRHHFRGRVEERRHPLNPRRTRTVVSPMSAPEPLRPNMVANDGANDCGTDNEGQLETIDAFGVQYSPCTAQHLEENFGSVVDAEAESGGDTASATATAATATSTARAAASPDRRTLLRAADGSESGFRERADRGEAEAESGADDDQRQPALRVHDAAGAADAVTVAVRPVGSDQGSDAATAFEVQPSDSDDATGGEPTGTARTATQGEAIATGAQRIDALEPGTYEVAVRHGDAIDATEIAVGPAGTAPDQTVSVRIRPDGSPVVSTVVACGW